MGNIRVHQLAKKLGLKHSATVLEALEALGIRGKSASSGLDQATIDKVRAKLASPKKAKVKPKAKAKTKTKAKTKVQVKTKAKVKTESNVRAAAKVKPRPKPKVEPEAKARTVAKAEVKTKLKVKPEAEARAKGKAPEPRKGMKTAERAKGELSAEASTPTAVQVAEPPKAQKAPRAPKKELRPKPSEPSAEQAGKPSSPDARARMRKLIAAVEGDEEQKWLRVRQEPKRGFRPSVSRVAGRVSRGLRRLPDLKTVPKPRGKLRHRGKPSEHVEEAPATAPRRKAIRLAEGISVKEFAELIGQKVSDVLRRLMDMGVMATINQPMDLDAAVLIADAYGLKAEAVGALSEGEVEEQADRPELLKARPPVVTIMGHVDHGKTSLLDAVRETRVTEQEAGGITQHIGAYDVSINGRHVVFLDTPGHEAFTAMRARGAQVTDVVVLVVAADDGVMPQTREAVDHARAAGVPIIVAINKIDKPEADSERVRRELADLGLIPEEWGGHTIFSEVSAKQRIGLDHMLEMISLQADVLELKANPDRAARGVVVEAKLDRGRGPVATVLVQNGTLRPGDCFVAGACYGRVRVLLNDRGGKILEATPSTPVEVIGFTGVPQAGDGFAVVEDERRARQIAALRAQKLRDANLGKVRRITLEDLHTRMQEGEVKELGVIIKADVQGSIEAMAEALGRVGTEAVAVKVLGSSVGGITETDVMFASASNAIIFGFNVRPEPKAKTLAEKEGVDIRLYTVIYDAIADTKAALEGLLEPIVKERVLGKAQVREIFSIPKVGTVAGCYVLDGSVSRACSGVRVVRDSVVVYEGRLGSLRRFKEDTREVQAGYECGISVENFNDIKVGDEIEVFVHEEEAAKL